MADVIGVESLTKKYDDLVAVDSISFSVRQGEVFGILGPNGAGKTTTSGVHRGTADSDRREHLCAGHGHRR